MKVSAIIPSLYEVDKDYLKLCVESLRETTKNSPHDWQIIVVTNGGTGEEQLKHIKGISIHLRTKDQGQCVATNMGANVADGEYLFVINSDMYFAPGWDNNLKFEHLVFSPNLVEPINNAGSAPPFVKFSGGFTLDEFIREDVDMFIGALTHGVNDGTAGIKPRRKENGFNLPFFIKKEVWQTIDGYDTNYDPWGSNSDTDLQTKINLAGITPVRVRDVLVYHFSNKSGTFNFDEHPERRDFWQNNWDYFKNKWGFDRDELKSDVWGNTNMLPQDKKKIKYQPKWVGKYENTP